MSAQPANGSRLEAMTAELASKVSASKRKNAPKEDEDDDEGDSGSDGDSDVVRFRSSPHLLGISNSEANWGRV